MKRLINIVLLVSLIAVFVYITFPSPEFPDIPPASIQSFEPADVETNLRRGYYTDLTRQEVISFYKKEFNKKYKFLTLELNYPPEEAQTIIRDQTNSTFLEELNHPLRESLYVNGFEPVTDEYEIILDGKRWRQKVIVRSVPSSLYVRYLSYLLTVTAGYFLVKEYKNVKK